MSGEGPEPASLDPRWEGWSIVTWESQSAGVRRTEAVRGCVGAWWAGRRHSVVILCVTPISPASAELLDSPGNAEWDRFGESVSCLDLSVRGSRALEWLNIRTIGGLCCLRSGDLLSARNMGRVTVREVTLALAGLGLRLGMETEVREWRARDR